MNCRTPLRRGRPSTGRRTNFFWHPSAAFMRQRRIVSCAPLYFVMSNDLFDHSAFDEREPLIPAQMRIGQSTLVEAELVENGRVEVAEVDGILDGAQANGVGGAHDLAAF